MGMWNMYVYLDNVSNKYFFVLKVSGEIIMSSHKLKEFYSCEDATEYALDLVKRFGWELHEIKQTKTA